MPKNLRAMRAQRTARGVPFIRLLDDQLSVAHTHRRAVEPLSHLFLGRQVHLDRLVERQVQRGDLFVGNLDCGDAGLFGGAGEYDGGWLTLLEL
jgi:hypothetical protein